MFMEYKGSVFSYRKGGGGYKTVGGQVFFTLQKGGGGGKGFSHAEGGRGTKCFGVIFTQELEVLAIFKSVGGGGGS